MGASGSSAVVIASLHTLEDELCEISVGTVLHDPSLHKLEAELCDFSDSLHKLEAECDVSDGMELLSVPMLHTCEAAPCMPSPKRASSDDERAASSIMRAAASEVTPLQLVLLPVGFALLAQGSSCSLRLPGTGQPPNSPAVLGSHEG